MGNIGSGRRRRRRVCVEECEKFPASTCPRCSRAVRAVYEVPPDVAISRNVESRAGEAACRQCLGLTYRARQLSKSAVLRLLEPHAYWQLREEFQGLMDAGGFSVSTPPPPEIEALGADAVGQWFHERDKRNARFEAVAQQLNSVPLDQAARLYFGQEIERPAPSKRRAKS